ncbi:MAG: FKBP-type peptidyl-prolyl cis-trans isomerase [Anaerolineales bacterium]|nr:FKBP-type peptidyl-prolyl cis-trans isomerase [Anaerolineales bacterium]
MSTRSERAQRRANRLRNQRIAILVIILLLLAGGAYLVWSGASDNSAGNLPNLSGMTTTASGLQYKDTQIGSGAEATPGKMVSVHYTGWLQNGVKFDSSLDRGQPFTLSVGVGQVIPGWDEGLVGMKVGGKRLLVIPPELGYGAAGSPPVIPPNATLIFEVELLEVK